MPSSRHRRKPKPKSKSWKPSGRQSRATGLEDYQSRTLWALHKQLQLTDFSLDRAPTVRADYWSLVIPGRYTPLEGRQLVAQYADVVERRLAEILKRQSVAYWIHVLRRVLPFYPDATPTTVTLMRASFEAAIQKYAARRYCDRVAFSTDVPAEHILAGEFIRRSPDYLVAATVARKQLVLTRFGIDELREFYLTEQLAHETWRCAAALRILGKGAALVAAANGFLDDRDELLDKLVKSYDARQRGFGTSATGTTFATRSDSPGVCFSPQYNADELSGAHLGELLTAALGSPVHLQDFVPNFYWSRVDLHAYLVAHEPFADAFFEAKGVRLADVVAFVTGLLSLCVSSWSESVLNFYRDWMRAYDGPLSGEQLQKAFRNCVAVGRDRLRLSSNEEVDIDRLILSVTVSPDPATISVLLGGPLAVVLPVDVDQYVIDFAWLDRFLYQLFFNVRLTDERFKGAFLEEIVREGRSVLNPAGCRNRSGEERQIDASFEVGQTLVIVECRAVGNSFGFELGAPAAIAFRRRIVDRALADIDEKAIWLALNPVGANYDISKFDFVLPIAVTPFVEFVPDLKAHYWLTDVLPRVMTPDELKAALDSNTFGAANVNAVRVTKSTGS